MTVQIRPRGGGLSYAPHRELAHLFRAICRRAAYGLAEADWQDWFGDYLRQSGCTSSDLADAVDRFCTFLQSFTDAGQPDVAAALTASGFPSLPRAAQLAFMARLGEAATVYAWACVKDAYRQNEPTPGLDEFCRAADEVRHLLTRSSPVSGTFGGCDGGAAVDWAAEAIELTAALQRQHEATHASGGA